MEANLSPDVVDKLARAAARRGISAELLTREAIERAVNYDSGFPWGVERGLAQIEADRSWHEAVGSRLEQKLADRQSGR